MIIIIIGVTKDPEFSPALELTFYMLHTTLTNPSQESAGLPNPQ